MLRFLVLAVMLVVSPLHGQGTGTLSPRDDRDFSFYDRGPYRPAVPRPDSVLGYAIGEMNTQYDAQQRVLLGIAAAAQDRVRVEEFATSAEGRTMRLFIVSAPENVERLDAIRAGLARIADPREGQPSELDAIAARTPAVVMLSFSVHGNESPGFEAAMTVLYQLAASDDPAIMDALRRTVVVINPSSNPDGHERFAVWYNSINVRNPDPESLEHREPWSIQGRYNHYRFDMNRDVIASTQREVQGIIGAMLRWHPMVAVDLHGMTTQYFFPPAARPVNANIGDEAAKWLEAIGRGNAAAFDRYGWMYYVRDVFDLYYPGYWDTWPSLTGATGMTYETDGGGWKGILWRRDDGSLLSFRDGIGKHHVAALATIETTGARAEERVRDYLRFRQDAVTAGRSDSFRRVVLVPGSDPVRAAELALALRRAGIEVRRTTEPFTARRAHAYSGGAPASQEFAGGAYIVDLAQPQGRLAKAILEPAAELDSAFAREQIERYRRNIRRGSSGVSEGYEFYDVTAWSLPVAFGVEAYWTEDMADVSGEMVPAPAVGPVTGIPMLDSALLVADRATGVPGGVTGGARARSAYVFGPERSGATPLALDLMREEFRVAVATQPIEAGGQRYARGSYVVRVARNDTTLHERIDALARSRSVEVAAVNSAFTDSAQFGVGSESTVSLGEMPAIALVGDEGISQTSYGAVWWSLERRYGIPIMPVSLNFLTGGDLAKVNVIIFPDASAGALSSRLGEDGAGRLRSWVRAGGTLITMGGASEWAAREDVDLTSARRVGPPAGDSAAEGSVDPAVEDAADVAAAPLDSLLAVTSPGAAVDAPVPIPGAHFDVLLDRTHWLTYGYDRRRITVMLDGGTFFQLSRQGTNVAVFPPLDSGPMHRAGFIWPDNTERLLRNTAFLIDEPAGDGRVVLFANEPMFRGWWRALDKMVLNAIVLGPSM